MKTFKKELSRIVAHKPTQKYINIGFNSCFYPFIYILPAILLSFELYLLHFYSIMLHSIIFVFELLLAAFSITQEEGGIPILNKYMCSEDILQYYPNHGPQTVKQIKSRAHEHIPTLLHTQTHTMGTAKPHTRYSLLAYPLIQC